MRKPAKKTSGSGADVPRKIAVGLVIVCTLLVVVNLLAWVFFRDEVVAQRKMEAMARDYYENYLYDKWDKDKLAELGVRGLPEATLRVLLTYDMGKNLDNEAYFTRSECDAIETAATFYPEEPYGRKDYRLEIKYSCNF